MGDRVETRDSLAWKEASTEMFSRLRARALELGYQILHDQFEDLSGSGGFRTRMDLDLIHPNDPLRQKHMVSWEFRRPLSEREALYAEAQGMFTSWLQHLEAFAASLRPDAPSVKPLRSSNRSGGLLVVGGLVAAGAAYWYFYLRGK